MTDCLIFMQIFVNSLQIVFLIFFGHYMLNLRYYQKIIINGKPTVSALFTIPYMKEFDNVGTKNLHK